MNDAWAMDFMSDRLFDETPFRVLTVVDCFTREALATAARTNFRAYQVIDELDRLACVRLRPEYPDHVWSYDFVHCQTNEGKAFRTLNILDEHTRECRAIRVKRKLNSTDVIDLLTDLFILRGVPADRTGPDEGL